MEVMIYLIVGALSLAVFYCYVWTRTVYGYWKRKGVRHPKPFFLLGNVCPRRIAPSELYLDSYQKYHNDKYVGLYDFTRAKLLIMDPELIQNVLIKDFSHFMNRESSAITANSNRKNDGGIFFLTGHKWKAVRNKLSPTFTAGKLKTMLDRMSECYNSVEELIESNGGKAQARELMFSYTIDLIASCAFGLDINKEKRTAAEFRQKGLKALSMDLPKLLWIILISNFPILTKLISPSLMNRDTARYFGTVINDALKYRRENGFKRNDFLQLLIQLKEKGSVDYHSIEPEDEYLNITKSSSTETFDFTENMVISEAFTFITAGMEPTGNTLTLTLSELAWRQDIQDKVRKEVLDALAKHDNKLTYEALKDMGYLENCILETLRLYPVGKLVRRVCTKKYQLDANVTLDVGDIIIVPARAIHLDPKYFQNPTKYYPERFQESTHPPCTFFPFGEGPRICIGMRFAMVEMKVVLSKLIQNYKVTPGENFEYPIPLNRWSSFSVPSKPVNLKFEKLNTM